MENEDKVRKLRLALFFDGANHSAALQKAKVRMEYPSLIESLNEKFFVVSARYYTGISDDDEHRGVRDFLGSLSKSGFVIVKKPVRHFPDGKIKGNVDIEIAVDMLQMAPRLDRVVLFSGDGDFTYLVDAVQRMGVHVTVCSHKPLASIELRDQCNEFLEIKEIMNYAAHH